jgi:ankyrin repeat protein
MPHKGGGGGDKTKQFWDGIKTQKQDAIRWCLNYGGISHATRDDDGYTGLHLAAMQNKPRSMETILDHLRRQVLSRGGGDIRGPPGPKKKACEEIEEKDDEHGMTCFMHACAKGSMECVKLLHVRWPLNFFILITDTWNIII